MQAFNDTSGSLASSVLRSIYGGKLRYADFNVRSKAAQ